MEREEKGGVSVGVSVGVGDDVSDDVDEGEGALVVASLARTK